MFYLLIIIVTVFIFNLAINEKFKQNHNKMFMIFLLILTILIPSLIAGARSLNVGTDTRGYLLADYTLSSNVSEFSEAINTSNEELGFISLVYLVTKIFGNIHIVMFFIELIIMIFVIKYAMRSETKQEAFFIMLFYMLLCFGESLCIMRQHISFAILLYSTKLLKEKKYLLLSLCFIAAYLFHSSSICFLLIYYFLYMNNKCSLEKLKKCILIILIFFALCLFNIDILLNILINVLHILPERYNLYINSTWFYSAYGNNIFTLRFFLNMAFISLILISYFLEEDEEQKKTNLISLVLMIINMLLYIKSRQFLILSRFSIYFFYGSLLLNPLIIKNLKIKKSTIQEKKVKLFLNSLLMILIILTFYGVVVFNSNNYNLLPYTMST